ncbi:hypothetical protein Cadr_000015261 [Camelus dromedarius]|uniref:Uncharacterized protein n=1 Tax=Camelus dromedarius TaxID=9838 RepID=A0A5N4DP62_CAMDR|nr:hypothetical protein Cadr_000015261 [Camelus dromedarius]
MGEGVEKGRDLEVWIMGLLRDGLRCGWLQDSPAKYGVGGVGLPLLPWLGWGSHNFCLRIGCIPPSPYSSTDLAQWPTLNPHAPSSRSPQSHKAGVKGGDHLAGKGVKSRPFSGSATRGFSETSAQFLEGSPDLPSRGARTWAPGLLSPDRPPGGPSTGVPRPGQDTDPAARARRHARAWTAATGAVGSALTALGQHSERAASFGALGRSLGIFGIRLSDPGVNPAASEFAQWGRGPPSPLFLAAAFVPAGLSAVAGRGTLSGFAWPPRGGMGRGGDGGSPGGTGKWLQLGRTGQRMARGLPHPLVKPSC